MPPKIKSINLTAMVEWARQREKGGRCAFSPILTRLYGIRLGIHRRNLLRLCNRLEGGPIFSQTVRDILTAYHGVTVGKFSYGPCLTPGCLPPGTCVGNFCSTAEGLAVYRVNHPVDRFSQHPFFFNSAIGLLETDEFDVPEPLVIGHDVWIGRGVTILPKCNIIGNGAVIGAGSVVTRDVAPFAIVAGNPAKVIRQRVSEKMVQDICNTCWWLKSLPDIVAHFPLFKENVTLEIISELSKGLRQFRD